MTEKPVSIQIRGGPTTKMQSLSINGVDISRYVRAYRIEGEAGEITRVMLEVLPLDGLDIDIAALIDISETIN